MRAVIIANGNIGNYPYIRSFIRDDDLIICADGGYRHAVSMGLKIDMLIGDMDSVGVIPEGVATLTASIQKDQTDTELAVDYARSRGTDAFLLLGCTGSRLDHSLTNILALINFTESAELIDDHNRIIHIRGSIRFNETPGTVLSLIPLTECRGVTTYGLQYPLDNATLRVGSGWSVSNVIVAEAGVKLDSGSLLAIMSID